MLVKNGALEDSLLGKHGGRTGFEIGDWSFHEFTARSHEVFDICNAFLIVAAPSVVGGGRIAL